MANDVSQLDRDAAESFYEGPCTRGLLETILSSHRIAAEARGMVDRMALKCAFDISRGQFKDDMYVTKQRLDQTHRFLKNYLSAASSLTAQGQREKMIDAMLDDPFIDDAHLTGTTQQAQRLEHYTDIAIAAWNTHPTEAAAPKGAMAEIERLREALARIAQIDSDGLESHTPQAMVSIARKALVDVDSDPPCTDCNDTGYNPNTERQCTCDAALKGNQ